jgi:hypothetical protein
MPIKLNVSLNEDDETLYNNDIKTFSGYYFDTLTNKSVADVSWSSIAVNEDNGFMVISSTGTNGTNTIAYSASGGEEWSNISLNTTGNTNHNWKSITFGNNRFVGVSASGTSPTLVSRTFYSTASTPTSTANFNYNNSIQNNNWEAITYGNGYFVAVATSGTNRVMYSQDAINWTIVNQTELNSVSWDSICYSLDLKRFVIVSNDGSGKIAYADFNPDKWTLAFSRESSTNNIINGVFNNVTWISKLKIFLTVGNSGIILKSLNGQIWTNVPSPNSNNFQSIIWSQELEILIIISSNGTGANKSFTTYNLDNPVFTNIWTTRSLQYSGTSWITGTWNRKFGSFIILGSSGSASEKVLTSKISGQSHFLEKKYYYDLIKTSNLLKFEYTNPDIVSAKLVAYKTYPLLSEIYGFRYFTFDQLPDGVTLNPITGEIICSAISIQNKKTYNIYAKNDNQTLTCEISITIFDSIKTLSGLTYSNNNVSTDLIDLLNINPTFTQGTNYSFSYEVIGASNVGSLPEGLEFSSYSGVIKGTPKDISPLLFYRIRATNPLGNTTKDISIVIYILKTFLQAGDVRGNISDNGQWEGFVSSFFNDSTITGGKIDKNYFYNSVGELIYNGILTLGIKRTFVVNTGVGSYKKQLYFTLDGDYNLDNWESIVIGSYTFLKSNSTRIYDKTNNYTQFIWELDDNIRYFTKKDNELYIIGKKIGSTAIIIIAPSGLNYTIPSLLLSGTVVSYQPTLETGFASNYTITPDLPTGITINSFSGIISGTIPYVSSNLNYIVSASNQSGITNKNITIRIVYSNITLTTGFSEQYNPDSFSTFEEGFVNGSYGSLSSTSIGVHTITQLRYYWNDNHILSFVLGISGTSFFSQNLLTKISIGSSVTINKTSTYNPSTGRGYTYDSNSYYTEIVGGVYYTYFTWYFGDIPSGQDAITNYGWDVFATRVYPSSYTPQVISFIIE